MTDKAGDKAAMLRRVREDVQDGLDEELEMEMDDESLDRLLEGASAHPRAPGIDRRVYFKELFRLQGELVKLQDWVVARSSRSWSCSKGATRRARGASSSASRSGSTRAFAVSPRCPRRASARGRSGTFSVTSRTCRPAGEIVLFDRSWYNRAGVERVMGFCSDEDVEEFFRTVPDFEQMLVRSGIVLVKYWFSITDDEQHLRFLMRIHDPLKQWKLSPMDLESRRRWEQYTKAKEAMLERTHIPEARWWIVEAVDKKRARLNCIHHLLQQVPYKEIEHAQVQMPERVRNPNYLRGPLPKEMYVPAVY